MTNDQPVRSERAKLMNLLGWVAGHPEVADVDDAAERTLSAIGDLALADDLPAEDHLILESLGELLNELVETVGNCETEERNLKALLWSQAAADAGEQVKRSGRIIGGPDA